MKDLKCSRCGKSYEPVLKLDQDRIYCMNCENLQAQSETSFIESVARNEEYKEKSLYTMKLNSILRYF